MQFIQNLNQYPITRIFEKAAIKSQKRKCDDRRHQNDSRHPSGPHKQDNDTRNNEKIKNKERNKFCIDNENHFQINEMINGPLEANESNMLSLSAKSKPHSRKKNGKNNRKSNEINTQLRDVSIRL